MPTERTRRSRSCQRRSAGSATPRCRASGLFESAGAAAQRAGRAASLLRPASPHIQHPGSTALLTCILQQTSGALAMGCCKKRVPNKSRPHPLLSLTPGWLAAPTDAAESRLARRRAGPAVGGVCENVEALPAAQCRACVWQQEQSATPDTVAGEPQPGSHRALMAQPYSEWPAAQPCEYRHSCQKSPTRGGALALAAHAGHSGRIPGVHAAALAAGSARPGVGQQVGEHAVAQREACAQTRGLQ